MTKESKESKLCVLCKHYGAYYGELHTFRYCRHPAATDSVSGTHGDCEDVRPRLCKGDWWEQGTPVRKYKFFGLIPTGEVENR